jgi:hypothetical protein
MAYAPGKRRGRRMHEAPDGDGMIQPIPPQGGTILLYSRVDYASVLWCMTLVPTVTRDMS